MLKQVLLTTTSTMTYIVKLSSMGYMFRPVSRYVQVYVVHSSNSNKGSKSVLFLCSVNAFLLPVLAKDGIPLSHSKRVSGHISYPDCGSTRFSKIFQANFVIETTVEPRLLSSSFTVYYSLINLSLEQSPFLCFVQRLICLKKHDFSEDESKAGFQKFVFLREYRRLTKSKKGKYFS